MSLQLEVGSWQWYYTVKHANCKLITANCKLHLHELHLEQFIPPFAGYKDAFVLGIVGDTV